jgi:hypothetical protein
MTIEWILLLLALWIVAGLLDAWILYRRGHSDWRLLLVCVLTGPLSIALVVDQIYLAEPESTPKDVDTSTSDHEPLVDEADARLQGPDDSVEWPADDPKGRFMLYGYRSLSDH